LYADDAVLHEDVKVNCDAYLRALHEMMGEDAYQSVLVGMDASILEAYQATFMD
jgi:hypothetical protein